MANMQLVQFFLLAQFAFLLITNSSHAHLPQSKDHVALFIFGDSVFDPGNNNYIHTIPYFLANYPPYGETFFHHPTGRFSDGRLIPDFIAEYADLPLIPPYKQPKGSPQFTYGVNFASAGAGALIETATGLVIDLRTQLAYFKNAKKVLEKMVGEEEAKKLLSRAVYVFNIGGNDYIRPPVANISRFFDKEEVVNMVIGNLTAVANEIYKTGGRKFGFVNLGPVSCYPGSRVNTGKCLKDFTTLVKLHNVALYKALERLKRRLQGFKYSYFDMYTSVSEKMNNPSKYGFEDGQSACCGSGRYRGLMSCGGMRGIPEYELCSNPSQYVFFDYAHLTEMANRQIAGMMWEGTSDVVKPCNLKSFFEQV